MVCQYEDHKSGSFLLKMTPQNRHILVNSLVITVYNSACPECLSALVWAGPERLLGLNSLRGIDVVLNAPLQPQF